jgi:hypothetical protein
MELVDAIYFVCTNYPQKDDLSNARLNKILFLADWKAALELGRKITDIDWIYNHHGPYVTEIIGTVHSSEFLEVETTANMYGNRKEVVKIQSAKNIAHLRGDDVRILSEVIAFASKLTFKSLIDFVYSTYPIVTQPKNSVLNLVELANKYKAIPRVA